jgi:hypothetical protein
MAPETVQRSAAGGKTDQEGLAVHRPGRENREEEQGNAAPIALRSI